MKFIKRIGAILLLILLLSSIITVSAEEESFQWDVSQDAILASLQEADITSIQEAYSMGILTCTQVTQYYLDRISAYNDTYNCFITLCDDALEQAAQKDTLMAEGKQEGHLFGIPMVIKDNMDYAGYYTTNGYGKNKSYIAKDNAQVVEYLVQEGAIIIGKANMSTAAQDARASKSIAGGETKNAYNDRLASGGSSGGSAVATALNFTVAALGTDTNSSLRLPAVLNGCISLRSTWGALSNDGIRKLNSRRDVPGVITRTVMDQAIILDVMSGGETSFAENLDSEALQGKRLGILKELAYRNSNIADDEVLVAFENAVDELESCGAEVIEISISNIRALASSSYGSSYYMDVMYRTVENAMEKNQIDAIIYPTYLHTPLRSGKDENGRYWNPSSQTYINNSSKFSSCARLPEIAIPIGYHSLGAGIGMEIAALKGQEQLLLDIAYSYTLQYDHRVAPMDSPNLYQSYYEGTLAGLIANYHESKAKFEEAQRLAKLEAERLAAEEAERLRIEEENRMAIEAEKRAEAERAALEIAIVDNRKKVALPILGVLGFVILVYVALLLITKMKEKNKTC